MTRTGLALLALALASCASGSNWASIEGSWRVVALQGVAPTSQQGMTLAFGAAGVLTAFGGCNTFGGRYAQDGASLKVVALAQSSARSCTSAQITVEEERYVDHLRAAVRWQKVSDTEIELARADGGIVRLQRDK
jgi:heat shock protein HslJ